MCSWMCLTDSELQRLASVLLDVTRWDQGGRWGEGGGRSGGEAL